MVIWPLDATWMYSVGTPKVYRDPRADFGAVFGYSWRLLTMRKRRTRRIFAMVAGLFALVAMVFFYALFHGHFDHGDFSIDHVEWAGDNQVAILAERSDR